MDKKQQAKACCLNYFYESLEPKGIAFASLN